MQKNILLLALLTLLTSQAHFGMEKSESSFPLPIVYHPNYNIGFWGIENIHPFDTKKYGKVYSYLQKNLADKINFFEPTEVTDYQLERIHGKKYIENLNKHTSAMIAEISEILPLALLPNFVTRNAVLTPMRLATNGTVLAAHLARGKKFAVNLSGGYHHAKKDSGGGFCALADIPLAAYTLLEDQTDIKKIMVIDLDAHQGNGHEAIFAHDKRIDIFDIYNADIYPQDFAVMSHIRYNHPVDSGIDDTEYLEKLQSTLPQAIEESNPDFIIYNAGTDVYEKDPLGKMNITAQGIVDRDAFVVKQAQNNNKPILMVLSGGYTKESADIISHSLENIINNVIT